MFESDVSFNAGIRDKDGDLGNTGWLLESTGSGKVNWVNPQGLTVENASKIGVGSVYGGTPLTSAGINTYFVTFVPDNNPIDDSIILIITAITTACSAQLSACFLFSSPIKRAIAAVTPVPSPIVNPSTKKKRGILNAMPVIASPPNFPMKIISTRL